MKRIITFFFLTMLACCVGSLHITSAHARESIILTDEQEKYPLGLHLEFFEDPTGGLTIDEETVIIALTASAFEEDRIKVMEHGCDDLVRKPFKENDIFVMM